MDWQPLWLLLVVAARLSSAARCRSINLSPAPSPHLRQGLVCNYVLALLS